MEEQSWDSVFKVVNHCHFLFKMDLNWVSEAAHSFCSYSNTGSVQVKEVTYLEENACSLSTDEQSKKPWGEPYQPALTNVLTGLYLSEHWQLCHLPSSLCSLWVFTRVYLESQLMLSSQWGERERERTRGWERERVSERENSLSLKH